MITPSLMIGLSSVAIVLAFFQYGTYVRDILRRKTRPHAFSWFAWGLPTVIVFFAQWEQGGGIGTWVTGVTGLICTAIFVLALFYGDMDFALLDWMSLAFSGVGIGLWAFTSDALWAVVLSTLVDVVGFVPTVRKSIMKPFEETMTTYALGGSKWVLSVIALEMFNPITLLYPLAMIAANWGFVAFLSYRRRAVSLAPAL